jgi:hypothetical protein
MRRMWRLSLTVLVFGVGFGNPLSAQQGTAPPKSLRFKPVSNKARTASPPAAVAPSTAVPSTAASVVASPPVEAGAPGGCSRCNDCGPCCERRTWRSGLLQRLREWLTYRARPVPRECHCHRHCAPCVPHPHAYLFFRYPHEGYAQIPPTYFGPTRPANTVRAPAANPPAPIPVNSAVELPPLRAR